MIILQCFIIFNCLPLIFIIIFENFNRLVIIPPSLKQQKNTNMPLIQSEDDVIVGKATFKPIFNHSKQQLISSSHSQILQSNIWQLNKIMTYFLIIIGHRYSVTFKNQAVKRYNYVSYFLHDEGDNYIPQIIFSLQFSFSHLKSLCLSLNNIRNIEALAFLNTQKLTSIKLSDNLIINMKSLNKIKWNQLKFIDLRDNLGKALNMNRIKMNKVQTKRLPSDSVKYPVFNEDLNFIAKLEPLEIKDSVQFSEKRIQQKKMILSLNKKYQSMTIWNLNIDRPDLIEPIDRLPIVIQPRAIHPLAILLRSIQDTLAQWE